MAKVLFSVSYSVRPDRRSDYLTYVRELRDRFRSGDGRIYDVFQTKGNDNQFSEIYQSDSEEDIEALEDSMDEATRALLLNIEDCMEKGTTRYTTLLKVE